MARSSLKCVNIFSKPVIQILLWVTLITTIYFSAFQGWPHTFKATIETITPFWKAQLFYMMLTLILILYPVGGIIGDTCLGRYKTISGGLILVMVSTLTASVPSVLLLIDYIRGVQSPGILPTVMILDTVAFLVFVIAISALNSNVLQFGLDQLMDKPSESLGVFVHWFLWALCFGETVTQIIYGIGYCSSSETRHIFNYFLHVLPLCSTVLLLMLLLISYYTRHQFNRDRVKYNPYKMIFKVFNFARKNKYPVGPVSAFTYCDNFRPSRLDYAKERYGGPFTTSDVEDVKAFKNVFLVLLVLGPIFILDIPIETYFNSFSSHLGFHFPLGSDNSTCEYISPESFTDLIALVLLPVYIWLLYSVFQSRRPKILHRLCIFVFLYILALVIMFLTDLSGHLSLYTHNQTQPKCMFVDEGALNHTTLDVHWAILIVPSALSKCHHLIMATALEFVSAQSPHTMIGVLVGTFYAFIGIFRFVGISFYIPFALEEIWEDGYLGQHPPVISCGFGYYLVCLTAILIGFISFITAVKRYKYRRRDEEPYSQACVEEIFARRIAQVSQLRRAGYQQLPK